MRGSLIKPGPLGILPNNASVPHLGDLKTMLAELYKATDEKKAGRLVNAVIEHLFETPEIPEFFADWKSAPGAVSRGREGLSH
jgi:hypothetical protein